MLRIVFVLGGAEGGRQLEFPWWKILALWLLTAGLLAFGVSQWLLREHSPLFRDMVDQARNDERAALLTNNRQAMQTLVPVLADLNFQVMQLEMQGSRLGALVGMRVDWGSKRFPQDPADLAISASNFDQVRRELDFISRQVELKTDAMSMVELFLIEQHLRARGTPEFVLPVPPTSRITSGYGPRFDPLTGQRAMHQGIDFEVAEGTPVLAVADGMVTRVASLPNYGNLVEISHRDGRVTRYAHLRQSLVRNGQAVHRGEVLGQSGNTGRSTGPHLHFEALELGIQQNPLTFFLRREPGNVSLPVANALRQR